MARNKLSDLNNLLFAQMEQLSDQEIPSEQMKLEIQKAQAMSKLASQIINSSKIVLQAAKLVGEGKLDKGRIPANLVEENSET